jgi:cytochrome c5
VSDQDNRRFFEHFSVVLGVLVVFTIIIYFVANHISGATQVQWSNDERASGGDMAERLKPVGSVAVTGESTAVVGETAAPGAAPSAAPATAPVETAAASAAPAAAASGEDIYNGTCFACHATGAAGAPKLGDKADWGPRIAKGTDTLVQHAISGFQGEKGIMPPKGGRADFSDDSIKAAVEFMMSKAVRTELAVRARVATAVRLTAPAVPVAFRQSVHGLSTCRQHARRAASRQCRRRD